MSSRANFYFFLLLNINSYFFCVNFISKNFQTSFYPPFTLRVESKHSFIRTDLCMAASSYVCYFVNFGLCYFSALLLSAPVFCYEGCIFSCLQWISKNIKLTASHHMRLRLFIPSLKCMQVCTFLNTYLHLLRSVQLLDCYLWYRTM